MKKIILKFFIFSLIFLLIIFFRIYLSLFGFSNFLRILKRRQRNFFNEDKMAYVLKSIKLSSSVIPNISCLIRAVTLKYIFNKVERLNVFIGIKISKEKLFESHAWVVRNDEVILNDDSSIHLYKVIYRV